jgi:hypothetical protein
MNSIANRRILLVAARGRRFSFGFRSVSRPLTAASNRSRRDVTYRLAGLERSVV